MVWKFLGMLAIGAGIAAGYALAAGMWRVPDRWNPWAVLRIEEDPHWLTRHKLARLSLDAALCREVLETAPMRWESVPDRDTGAGCGFRDAVRIKETQLQVGAAFPLSCPAAVSLALWERHVLLPAAARYLEQPLVRLEHLGSYACRNVNGANGMGDTSGGRRSRHATADALDIAGFTLAGGRRISVLRDWADDGPEGAFLREVHGGACSVFDGVLGPDYNAAHRDHFHLDRGSFRVCR